MTERIRKSICLIMITALAAFGFGAFSSEAPESSVHAATTVDYAAIKTKNRVIVTKALNDDSAYTVTVVNPMYKGKPAKKVFMPTWSRKKGQDDRRWYKAKKVARNAWAVTVRRAKHKNAGIYYTHIYAGKSRRASRRVRAVSYKIKDPFVVFVDAGHGGTDSGAKAFDRAERDDNLRMAQAVQRALINRGARVVMARTNIDASYRGISDLNARIRRANKLKVNVYIALHRDAPGSATKDPQGYAVFTHSMKKSCCPAGEYKNKHAKSRKLAQALNTNLAQSTGMKSRGIYYGTIYGSNSDYNVNSMTKMASCLVEMGFITNESDNALFDQRIEANADAIARAIVSVR